MIVGTGEYRYHWAEDWGEIPPSMDIRVVAGVGIGENDTVFLLTRSKPAILIFSSEGRLLNTWDDELFVRPHCVCVDDERNLYVVDDGGHVVYLMNSRREIRKVLGTKGIPSDSGCVDKDYHTIRWGAPPFNFPTGIAVAENGDMYISDGYGNARVHVFDRKGNLKFSWGQPGEAPGEFNLPHGIALYSGVVYVADRQNNRVQLFDLHGNYLDMWVDFERPAGICIDGSGVVYVSECKRSNTFDGAPSRVTLLSTEGKILSRLGGQFYDPDLGYHTAHGIAVDSQGSIYVADVGKGFPEGYFGLKKYVRI